MAEKHPDELVLLSYVEEELDDRARQDVVEHLVACRACAGQVRRLEAGRDALQAAPLLELPDARRSEILSALPDRPDRWRLFRPVKRGLVIVAPVAAAATVFVALIVGGMQLDGGGDDDSGDAAGGDVAAADTQQQDAGPEEVAPFSTLEDATVVRQVKGPAAEVLRVLANEGITAQIVDPRSILADARAGEVRVALADRPSGGVAVYVR